jgi:hypothetical protein
MDDISKIPLNQARISKENVLTVTIYLDGKPAAFAEAIGSLVLAQDMVKAHFSQRSMQEAVKQKMSGIIRPNGGS